MSDKIDEKPDKETEKIAEFNQLLEQIQPRIYIVGSDKHCQRCMHINTCLLAYEMKHLIKSKCRSYWEKPRKFKPVAEERLTSRDVIKNIEETWLAMLAVIPHSCVFYTPRKGVITITLNKGE